MAARKKKSGKRSAASSTPRRHKPLIFFIDECLGSRLVADALARHGAHVELARDHFPEGTKDTDWLPTVGNRGWIVLTKDRHIRRRQLEIEALVNARVRAFVLTAADLTGPEQADVFVRALPKITRICARSRGPLIAALGERGGVALVPLPRVGRSRR